MELTTNNQQLKTNHRYRREENTLMSDAVPYDRIAELYDACVQVTLDVPFYLEQAARTNGPVLELMAGTGRVSLPLIKAGVDLTCVDYSADMLDVLRRKLYGQGLSAALHKMDERKLKLNRLFVLIFIPFQSFTEITDPDDECRTLERIHAHLADGGRLICTLHNPAVRLRSVDGLYRLWHKAPLPSGGLVLLWGSQTHQDGLVSIDEFYEVFDARRMMQARHHVELVFRLLTRMEFETMASEAGFAVEALYGSYDRSPFEEESSPYMIWILGKAQST